MRNRNLSFGIEFTCIKNAMKAADSTGLGIVLRTLPLSSKLVLEQVSKELQIITGTLAWIASPYAWKMPIGKVVLV